jgi:hypothetical protein
VAEVAVQEGTKIIYTHEWACGLVVGLSSGTLPTRVRTLVIAHFSIIFSVHARVRVSRALEVTPPNLLSACGVSVKCVSCVRPSCIR